MPNKIINLIVWAALVGSTSLLLNIGHAITKTHFNASKSKTVISAPEESTLSFTQKKETTQQIITRAEITQSLKDLKAKIEEGAVLEAEVAQITAMRTAISAAYTDAKGDLVKPWADIDTKLELLETELAYKKAATSLTIIDRLEIELGKNTLAESE